MRSYPKVVTLVFACSLLLFSQNPSTPSRNQWDREKESVYLADFSRAHPPVALSSDGRRGTWKVVPFATEDVRGKMIFSAPGTPVAPELTIESPVSGWHAIYVAINYQFIWERPQLLKLRLGSDPAFTWFMREGELGLRTAPRSGEHGKIFDEKSYTDRDVVEVFWKAADLREGERVHVARKDYAPLRLWHAGTDYADTVSNLTYLKFVPLSGQEIEEWKASLGRSDTRRVLAINDMGWLRWVRSREEVREELEPLRDTDVGGILWGTFRGFYTSYFKTRVGSVPTGGDNEFQKFFTTFGEGMDKFRELEIDPLEEAVSYAHSLGIRLIASLRMDGPKPPPYDGSPGPLYDRHPEYRCVDRDGSVMPRISLAFPEVRRTFVEMFREAVDYDADGAAVIFSRNYPFVGFEEPVLKVFRLQENLTATAVNPADPAWLAHQASFVTAFLREIRQMLESESRKRSRPLQLVVMVRGTLEHQLDVEAWIKERLVDVLILHPWGAPTVTEDRVRQFSAMAKGSGIPIYVDFYPRQLPAELIRQNALKYYASGADGFCLWDSDGRMKRPGEWAMWSRLGHRSELARWERQARRLFRVVPLKELAGYKLDASWWHSTG